MAETSGELERDLRRLREDTSHVLAELEDRLADATDVQKQVKRHPYVAVGVGAATLGGLGLLTYGLWTRSHGPSGGIWPLAGEHRRSLIEDAKGKVVHIGGRGMIHEEHREAAHSEGLMKRIMWGIMVSVGLTVATYMARKVLESAWTKTTGEAPPGH